MYTKLFKGIGFSYLFTLCSFFIFAIVLHFTNVPDSVIKEIAKRQPLRAVFRDSSFANSPSKINVGEIFKLMAPDTRVKVI